MGSTLGQALLLLAAAASLARAQVEKIGSAAESAGGGSSALAGSSLNAAPAPISFAVAPLNAAPLRASPAAAAPALAGEPAAAPAVGPPLAPALAAPAALPAAFVPSKESGAAAPSPRAEAPGASSDGAVPDDGAAPGGDAAEGRAFFDAAAPAEKDDAGVWARLKGWAGLGDRIPSWPGVPDERIRLGKRTFTLSTPLGAGLWHTRERDYVVQLSPPGRTAAAEAALLRAIESSDIPHARLVAASADDRVLVKEFITGDDAAALLARGFETRHAQGWAELAARLIRAGVTADLSPRNLIWQHWRTRWVLVDARGLRKAGPREILAGLLTPAARRAGADPGVFLAALRGRLGPDSAEWTRTLTELGASERAALETRDRAFPAPPSIVFGPGEEHAPFPNAVGPAADPIKTLGYDPLTVKPRGMLHTDDPGKLNTEVFSVSPEGKTRVAVKIADWRIIRKELAVRRVIRRWFGRYFDEPSAFGVENGRDSYLVMEYKPGEASWSTRGLSLKRRAALAVLVHAFGIGDMNPGNVLYPAKGKPVLLDFEQALSRRTPVAGRIPDEGIALEMPWLSRAELNRAEDYQPAVRAWRALLAEPASAAALLSDFKAAGYSAEESAALLDVVRRNTADLDWTIQNDVEFVNQFAARRTAAAARQ